jgi:peroxiredoxin
LCDEDRSVIKAYGVWHPIGIDAINMARPASFLIDAARTIRYVFVGSSQFERADLQAILKVADTL